MASDWEPRALVRSFSEELAQKNANNTRGTLEAVVSKEYAILQSAEEPSRWRQYYEASDTSNSHPETQERLNEQALKLKAIWGKFRESLPPEQKIKFDRRMTNFNDVRDIMMDVEKQWDEKRKKGLVGKAGLYYRQCCSFIKSHETMLKVIPEGNEYVSLFSGVLRTVVSATARYEQTAIGLSKLILQVSEEVAVCCQFHDFYATAEMKVKIMGLYCLVFKFLTDVLEWFLSKGLKKLWGSLNENLYRDFEDQVQDIVSFAGAIRVTGGLGQAAEIRSMRIAADQTQTMVASIAADIKKSLEIDYQRMRKDLAVTAERERRETLASKDERIGRSLQLRIEVVGNYQAGFEAMARDAMFLIQTSINDQGPGAPAAKVMLEPAKGVQQFPVQDSTYMTELSQHKSKDDALVATRDFEDLFVRSQVRVMVDTEAFKLPAEIIDQLGEWIVNPESGVLAVAGSTGNDEGPVSSTASAITARLIELADRARVPVVSYFCIPKWTRRRMDEESIQMSELTALTVALIRQLLELGPSAMDYARVLDFGDVAKLDGTSQTYSKALQLLRNVLPLAPPLCYIMIQGFDLLDDRSTAKHLDEFLAILLDVVQEHSPGNVTLKLLFVTAEPSRCLMRRNLKRGEYIYWEGRGGGEYMD